MRMCACPYVFQKRDKYWTSVWYQVVVDPRVPPKKMLFDSDRLYSGIELIADRSQQPPE